MARSATNNWPQVRTEYFAPEGGLDIVSPPFLVKNGVAISGQNMEVDLEAGYSRIGGYDRFVNGPTVAEQDIKKATVRTEFQLVLDYAQSGDVIVGGTSGAEMTFIAITDGSDAESGVMEGGGVTYPIYVAEVIGTFVAGENAILTRTGGTTGLEAIPFTVITPPAHLGGVTPDERAALREAADTRSRIQWKKPSSIGSPTTTDPILGLAMLNDIPIVLFAHSNFNIGKVIFVQPGGSSASTIFNSRSWLYRHVSTIPAAGAKFEFVVSSAGSNIDLDFTTDRLWGVSGTSKAFVYYDGTLTYISTSTDTTFDDTPDHIAIHQGQLFLAYGDNLQWSGNINNPEFPVTEVTSWIAAAGAGAKNMGSTITGLMSLAGQSEQSALLISTVDKLFIAYGDADGAFQIVPFAENSGAYPYTLQFMGKALFQNAFGLTSLGASQVFGGFRESAFSGSIKPFIDARRGRAVASMIVRGKNQYRVFFDDGSGIYATFKDGKSIGMFPIQFPHNVTCACSGVIKGAINPVTHLRMSSLPVGEEVLLVGTDEGEVYRLDVGWSFQEEPIEWNLRMAFNHLKSPRYLKRFVRTAIELQSAGYTKIAVGYDLDYRGDERAITDNQTIRSEESGANQFWVDAVWGLSKWDMTTTEPFTLDTPGTGVNFSLRLAGDDKSTQPFTLTGVVLTYSIRRLKR